jgi:hypothetical protein
VTGSCDDTGVRREVGGAAAEEESREGEGGGGEEETWARGRAGRWGSGLRLGFGVGGRGGRGYWVGVWVVGGAIAKWFGDICKNLNFSSSSRNKVWFERLFAKYMNIGIG